MEELYTTGKFAKKAGVTLRTIRYYDSINLLKPTYIKENGYRLYCNKDLIKLQKIIILKELGFPLDQIINLIQNDKVTNFINSLSSQITIIDQKINHLNTLKESIRETKRLLNQNTIPWDKIIETIKLATNNTTIINSYLSKNHLNYQNKLDKKYGTNKISLSTWLFNQIDFSKIYRLIEIEARDKNLWLDKNINLRNREIFLTNTSNEFLDDLRHDLGNDFNYLLIKDELLFKNNFFDALIINQTSSTIKLTIKDLKRVTKKDGLIYWLKPSKNNLYELNKLLTTFNPILSIIDYKDTNKIKSTYIKKTIIYQNKLLITKADDLIDYLLTCNIKNKDLLTSNLNNFKKYLNTLIKENSHIVLTKEYNLTIYNNT